MNYLELEQGWLREKKYTPWVAVGGGSMWIKRRGSPVGLGWREWERVCIVTCWERQRRGTCEQIHGDEPYWQQQTTLGEWYHAKYGFGETYFEYMFFDPPDALPNWVAALGPDLLRGDTVQMETDWLQSISGVEKYEVDFDGEPYKHKQVIKTDTLGAGHHVFHIDVRLASGEKRNYEIAFSLMNKLEVWFEKPVVPFNAESRSKSNGTVLPLTIINNTPRELHAMLAMINVPRGWKAVVPGTNVIPLKAKERKTVEIQVEMMNETGFIDGLLAPFTVGATTNFDHLKIGSWLQRDANFATGYVQIKAKPTTANALIKSPAARLRASRQKSYGKQRRR